MTSLKIFSLALLLAALATAAARADDRVPTGGFGISDLFRPTEEKQAVRADDYRPLPKGETAGDIAGLGDEGLSTANGN